MNKTILGLGIFFGLTAVMLGAFGAHGLTNLVDSKSLDTFGTGVQYQMYHAFFLMILSTLNPLSTKKRKLISYFIVLGIICFSFSIYFLATNELTSFDFKRIALITPLGGVFLIVGWVLLGVGVMKTENPK
ncbi:hypothetical protein KCTC52924_01685 [Arenibacter antarcticus]|uniref:DUF423 domain-containing protein n=1 Tax=Arenibacter antarcticus TaxID=2040469 RepID=A0ABW5VH78_9FLAO|nr:DUF423 domain-containing protein [Arenibacter sp. H213]MCM4166831.1 DUF423 domain-containing protein [Arenibacter sp. H213]